MTFRAFATSDLHIDERSPRWGECQRILDWIVALVAAGFAIPQETCKACGCVPLGQCCPCSCHETASRAHERGEYLKSNPADVVLIPGDIYEGESTPAERLVASRFVRGLAEHCPVVIVRGNHDRKRDLQILAELESEHEIHVVEDVKVIPIGGRDGGMLDVACMAWPTRRGITNEGAAREAIADVLRSMDHPIVDGNARILMGHFDVSGATIGEGQPVIGGALTVGLEDLALAGAHATVMGHIHRAQLWHYNGRPIGYCGSPFRTDFGEPETKGIVGLEIDGDTASWEVIATPARDMVLMQSAWIPELGVFGSFDDSHSHDVELRGSDVRFRYSVDKEHRDAAKREAKALEDRWLAAGAATVQLEDELVVVTRARDVAVAVAEERTTEGKLEAMWVAQNRLPDPTVKSRIFGRLAELEVTP